MTGRGGIGSLTVVGYGITAVSHLTVEALGHIREADVVLHNLRDVAAAHVASLNANCIECGTLYKEEKLRRATYVQMAELILREVRAGRRTVALFYGHPAILSYAARRALAIAEREGAKVTQLAGISSLDSLLADLRVPIDGRGCRIVAADVFMSQRLQVSSDCPLVVMMPSSLGHPTGPSAQGYDKAKPERLFARLADIYGADHPCVLYSGAMVPTALPIMLHKTLGQCVEERQDIPPHWTLYVPPVELPATDGEHPGGFDGYGAFETQAIAELGDRPHTSTIAKASGMAAILKIMTKVAASPTFAASAPWLFPQRNSRNGS